MQCDLLQEDRQKQADGFVRSMYKKPQPEDYLKRFTGTSVQVSADTAAIPIYTEAAWDGN